MFPLQLTLTLLVIVNPVGRHSLIANTIDEERCWRDLEAGKAGWFFMHRGVGDPDPALDVSACLFTEQSAYPLFVDPDRFERVKERVMRYGILLA
jgi:hypothetical protein